MGEIDAHTALYCIFGSPVTHSKSPLIHNKAFEAHHINAAYLAFEPKDIKKAVQSMRNLNIRGASVTIPFKQSVMEHLDWLDEQASAIGAVNTIVNRDGRLLGYNTDSHAAVAPLADFGIAGKKVLVIGAGGAARAVAFGIHKQNGHIMIANRSRSKGEDLAKSYNARFVPLEEIHTLTPDVIINTTSLGMAPHSDELACPKACLTPSCVVMDVVYTPLETRLLSLARQKGCQTVDGLSMFVAQGAAQFELWTGITPDVCAMRREILKTV